MCGSEIVKNNISTLSYVSMQYVSILQLIV